MASWMIHFRVADALLRAGMLGDAPDRIAAFFSLGNVAPDSGVPVSDGRGYVPDKATSHFMRRFEGVPAGENPERCDPAAFARTWLEPAPEGDDPVAAAFYLGYLCHLVTDNAWVRDFVYPAKVRFAHLRLVDGVETPEGVARFYAFLKRDWYDADFLYVKKHPVPRAYALFLGAEDVENRFLPFFPAHAFALKRAEIEDFYRHGAAEAVERETYPTEDALAEFIRGVCEEIRGGFGDLFHVFCSKLTLYSQISC